MPWKLEVVDFREHLVTPGDTSHFKWSRWPVSSERDRAEGRVHMKPGSVFFPDWPEGIERKESAHYKRDWKGKRSVLWIALPMGTWWSPDLTQSTGDGGWTVTGAAPFITCSPSINVVGYYHGWVKDGILSDDCEGRKFNLDGTGVKA